MITHADDKTNSPIKRMNLLNVSHSSPSLLSSNGGGFFNLNMMQCNESNKEASREEENVFKLRRIQHTTDDEESKSSDSDDDSKQDEDDSENPTVERKDFVPMSPDGKMRRKRRQRANEIANNKHMLIDAEN